MDEIIPGLYLGDMNDAKTAPADIVRVCVLENCISKKWKKWHPYTIHIPILVPDIEEPFGVVWYKASVPQLGMVARTIDFLLRDGQKVLVHCWASVERSPLAVAFYLHTAKRITLDEAYAFVESKHPLTQRRDKDWLRKPLSTPGAIR